MEFSNINPNNLTLAEIREEAYKQGRAEGYSQAEKDYFKRTEADRESSYICGRITVLNQLLERLSHFNDTQNGNEHFLYGIETCREMIEQMKEGNNDNSRDNTQAVRV